MKYNIIVSIKASKNYDDIFEYIAQDNFSKAKEFTSELLKRINELKDFPLLGVPLEGTDPSRRKLVYKKYVIAYKVNEAKKSIVVLHIRHGARKPLKS